MADIKIYGKLVNATTDGIIADYNQLDGKPIIKTNSFTTGSFTANTYYLYTGTTTSSYTNGKIYFYDGSEFSEIGASVNIANVYRYRGSVQTKSNLPASDNTAGDVYNVKDSGINYAWTGSEWDSLGAENYVTTDTNQTITGNKNFNQLNVKEASSETHISIYNARLRFYNADLKETASLYLDRWCKNKNYYDETPILSLILPDLTGDYTFAPMPTETPTEDSLVVYSSTHIPKYLQTNELIYAHRTSGAYGVNGDVTVMDGLTLKYPLCIGTDSDNFAEYHEDAVLFTTDGKITRLSKPWYVGEYSIGMLPETVPTSASIAQYSSTGVSWKPCDELINYRVYTLLELQDETYGQERIQYVFEHPESCRIRFRLFDSFFAKQTNNKLSYIGLSIIDGESIIYEVLLIKNAENYKVETNTFKLVDFGKCVVNPTVSDDAPDLTSLGLYNTNYKIPHVAFGGLYRHTVTFTVKASTTTYKCTFVDTKKEAYTLASQLFENMYIFGSPVVYNTYIYGFLHDIHKKSNTDLTPVMTITYNYKDNDSVGTDIELGAAVEDTVTTFTSEEVTLSKISLYENNVINIADKAPTVDSVLAIDTTGKATFKPLSDLGGSGGSSTGSSITLSIYDENVSEQKDLNLSILQNAEYAAGNYAIGYLPKTLGYFSSENYIYYKFPVYSQNCGVEWRDYYPTPLYYGRPIYEEDYIQSGDRRIALSIDGSSSEANNVYGLQVLLGYLPRTLPEDNNSVPVYSATGDVSWKTYPDISKTYISQSSISANIDAMIANPDAYVIGVGEGSASIPFRAKIGQTLVYEGVTYSTFMDVYYYMRYDIDITNKTYKQPVSYEISHFKYTYSHEVFIQSKSTDDNLTIFFTDVHQVNVSKNTLGRTIGKFVKGELGGENVKGFVTGYENTSGTTWTLTISSILDSSNGGKIVTFDTSVTTDWTITDTVEKVN